jgi:hypothetical protein
LAVLSIQFNAPFIYDDQIQMMMAPCAFAASLASGRLINLQLDHDADTIAANTDSGFKLKETDIGLTCRPSHRVVWAISQKSCAPVPAGSLSLAIRPS